MPDSIRRYFAIVLSLTLSACDRSTFSALPQSTPALAAMQEEKPKPPARPKPEVQTPTTKPSGPPASQGTATTSAPASARVLKPEDFKGLPWRSIGPANMGGRIATIALSPGNAKTFFIGFGTGGLFKTSNNGTTFSPLFDKESTASIGSVAIADAPPDWPGWKDEPAEPAGQAASKPTVATDKDKDKEKDKGKAKIIWVGTGEGNGRNSSSWGTGIYRSTDGGGTFTNVGLHDAHDIPALAVDPRNPDICYAAALGHLWGPNKERGVYKTDDGGKTWKPALQIDENVGCCDVILDPQNPDIAFAAMYMRRRSAFSEVSGGPPGSGGIYKTIDAGAAWKMLTNGLPGQTGRIGLDIYRKDPRIVYAIVESDTGGWGNEPFDDRSKEGGVFRSEDHGETWKRINDRSPRAFYFSKIRIDPNDDQRIYRLGWGLDTSSDGGATFRAGGARKPHGDLHAMVIDPADSEHLLMGTDGGLYVSYDRGESWDFINTIAAGEFYNVAFDMSDPYRIAGGLQDNGSWFGPSGTIWQTEGEGPDDKGAGITNSDWRFMSDGDGFHVAFDPTDSNIVYGESQGGVLCRVNLKTGEQKCLKPAPKEGHARFRFNWNTPFLISPHNPTTLYLGGNYVFKMTDRGARYERISDDLSTKAIEKLESVGSEAETHCTVVSLAESPLVAGLLWAGTDDGLIHITQNDGKSWSNVTPAEVGGRYISKIEPSHHDRNTAYVAVDGHRMDDMKPHLMLTTDLGKTWKSIASDLPEDGHVKVVREDIKNLDVLYAGTERAAFISIDRGQHWIKINAESLPTVAVDDIAQHPREMDLIAGTHGRSIYVLDDASALSQLTPQVVQSEFQVFEIMPARPRYFLPYAGFWDNRMFRAANPAMGARFTYWIRDYTGDEVKLSIEDSRGAKVRDLTGSNKPGLNRVVWDLQPEEFDRMPLPAEEPDKTQFVPAGEYKVNLSYGKRKATKTFTVLAAPGAGVPPQ